MKNEEEKNKKVLLEKLGCRMWLQSAYSAYNNFKIAFILIFIFFYNTIFCFTVGATTLTIDFVETKYDRQTKTVSIELGITNTDAFATTLYYHIRAYNKILPCAYEWEKLVGTYCTQPLFGYMNLLITTVWDCTDKDGIPVKEGEYSIIIEAYNGRGGSDWEKIYIPVYSFSDVESEAVIQIPKIDYDYEYMPGCVVFKFPIINRDISAREVEVVGEVIDSDGYQVALLRNTYYLSKAHHENRNYSIITYPQLIWCYKDTRGKSVPEGEYKVLISATDDEGNTSIIKAATTTYILPPEIHLDYYVVGNKIIGTTNPNNILIVDDGIKPPFQIVADSDGNFEAEISTQAGTRGIKVTSTQP